MADVEHVVVLMLENRGYEHYFGTLALPGSAGFGDKQAMVFRNGQTIFYQPFAGYPEGMLPWRLDTTKLNGQDTRKTGAWFQGYFERQDIPWHYALASAYTVGDHYHCSFLTGTNPNRIMLMSGTNDPDGLHGGPAIDDNFSNNYVATWQSYPEALQAAGVSWQVYVNNDAVIDAPTIDSDIDTTFFNDDGVNMLRTFASFNPVNANPENSAPRQGLLARGNVLEYNTTPPPGVPNAPSPVNLEYVLADFTNDCATGQLPEVSWIIPPAGWWEHPVSSTPNWGAVFSTRVIQALHANPDVWDSTLLIVCYDENQAGLFFDHVLRPVPEPGILDAGGEGINPGLGSRVPLVLVSPWTRGGWVAKETFDHTSIIQLMEQFTTSMGKPALCPNISDWRRSICGDLTSAIDFTSFDNSLPELPDSAGLLAEVVADAELPVPAPPAPGQQTFPLQQVEGQVRLRPAPYQQHATIQVDRATGQVTATMSNTSAKAASMQVFPGSSLASPFNFDTDTTSLCVPHTVSKETGPKTYTVDTTATGGTYDFAIYGPDHFIRSFEGTVTPDGEDGGQVPEADAKLGTGHTKALEITLSNRGRTPVQYTLTPNDYEGQPQTLTVRFGQHVSIAWPTSQYGYYDVTITANTNDGFTQRYAGHIS